MENLKHSKIGIISFWVAISPIICVVLISIKDILFPTNVYSSDIRLDLLIMGVALLISFSGLILGIVAITQKGYRKKLPISSIIISSLILSIPIIMIVIDVIKMPHV